MSWLTADAEQTGRWKHTAAGTSSPVAPVYGDGDERRTQETRLKLAFVGSCEEEPSHHTSSHTQMRLHARGHMTHVRHHFSLRWNMWWVMKPVWFSLHLLRPPFSSPVLSWSSQFTLPLFLSFLLYLLFSSHRLYLCVFPSLFSPVSAGGIQMFQMALLSATFVILKADVILSGADEKESRSDLNLRHFLGHH